jgi:hypothetical protein
LSVEDVLPQGGFLSVCYYGDNPDVQGTALAQLAAEPEVREWLASMHAALAGAVQLGAQFLKVNVALLRPLLKSQVGVVIAAPDDAGDEPGILVVARVGGVEAAARRGAEAFITQAAALAGQEQREDFGDAEVRVLGDPVSPVLFAFRGEFLLFSTSGVLFREALSKATAKLSSLPVLERLNDRPGSPVALLLYHHDAVMKRFQEGFGQQQRMIYDALGIGNASTLGFRLAADGKAIVGSLFVRTVGERQGFVRAMAGEPVDPKLLSLVPRDSSIAAVTSVDPGELYDGIIAVIDGIAGPRENIRGSIAAFEQKAGLDIRRDIFGSLGRGAVIGTSGASLVPAVVVSQAATDGERFETSMEKLVKGFDGMMRRPGEKGAGMELRTIRYRDRSIRYVTFPGVPVPAAPCFVRRGGRVLFGLAPVHLKNALDFLEDGGPTVLADPGLQKLLPRVPKDARFVAYTDTGGAFVQAYGLAGPFLTTLQGIPGNPVPIDLANLPATRTVRKHMFPGISYSVATEDMLVLESRSPFGVELMAPVPVLLMATAVFGLRAEGFVLAQDIGQQNVSAAHVKEILIGCTIYALDHDGALPPDLVTLIGQGAIQPKTLVAPRDHRPILVRDNHRSSYTYVLKRYPKLKLRLGRVPRPSQFPAVWERLSFDGRTRVVGFLDGHVRAVLEPEFQQMMKRLDGVVAKMRRGPAGHL